jgi:hypothetical protein
MRLPFEWCCWLPGLRLPVSGCVRAAGGARHALAEQRKSSRSERVVFFEVTSGALGRSGLPITRRAVTEMLT